MGQSRITTDSPAAGATGMLGRLLEIVGRFFLQGFRASRRSSITDKVLRDRLRGKVSEELRFLLFTAFKDSYLLDSVGRK